MVPDLIEEIFLRLPLKSLLKFKTVSKQCKSVIESKRFVERRRRMQVQTKPEILVAGNQLEADDEDDEIEMVCFHCNDAAAKPSLSCDGLVCIPVPGWVNVLNPSTGVLCRFPSGPDPVTNRAPPLLHGKESICLAFDNYAVMGFKFEFLNVTIFVCCRSMVEFFPGFRTMGFGKDIVTGSYKVVRMFFDPSPSCEILDVSIGEWRSVRPPMYRVDSRRKSVCVNGSIYWLEMYSTLCFLALDLHTEEFRDVPAPARTCYVSDQVVNLEDRLAIGSFSNSMLEIWVLDAEEEKWSMTYCIDVMPIALSGTWKVWYRPVAVSERGSVYVHDSWNRLLKYDPQTDSLSCICSDVCVVSLYVENLVSLRPASDSMSSGYRSGLRYLGQAPGSRIDMRIPDQAPGSRIDMRIPNVLFVTSLLSLIVARHFFVRS